MSSQQKIPLAVPDISDLEKQYVNDALESTWISSTGKYINEFETLCSEMAGSKHAIAVTNGTVALHLALLALGIGPGDEVIIPSLTYIATANAVRYVGAQPVFVDVDPHNWCLSPTAVARAITSQTKAIIAVHLYGHPADMDRINALAKKNGLVVIEDAAEAHTATYKKQLVGGLADIGTFSFYGNKIFSSGEGGVVTLNNDALAQKIRILKGQGMDPKRRYFFPVVGYNYRMTNIAAALAVAQLRRKNEILKKRRQIFSEYQRLLANIPGIQLQPRSRWASPAPWFYSVTVNETEYGLSRNKLMKLLEKRGIETRPFFIPIHTLPPYHEHSKKELPVTMALANNGLNLPTHTSLTLENVRRICSVIQEKR